MARPSAFGELIASLTQEHREVENQIAELKKALRARKYAKAAAIIPGFCDTLRQHIIDEEARVLKLLIDVLGRDGATEAIETFQQHRTIHNRIEDLEKIAARTPGLLAPKVAELEDLLRDHLRREEQTIFPAALDAHRGTARAE